MRLKGYMICIRHLSLYAYICQCDVPYIIHPLYLAFLKHPKILRHVVCVKKKMQKNSCSLFHPGQLLLKQGKISFIPVRVLTTRVFRHVVPSDG